MCVLNKKQIYTLTLSQPCSNEKDYTVHQNKFTNITLCIKRSLNYCMLAFAVPRQNISEFCCFVQQLEAKRNEKMAFNNRCQLGLAIGDFAKINTNAHVQCMQLSTHTCSLMPKQPSHDMLIRDEKKFCLQHSVASTMSMGHC